MALRLLDVPAAAVPDCEPPSEHADPKIARSESSALTLVRVHAGARITSEGPIAPDGR